MPAARAGRLISVRSLVGASAANTVCLAAQALVFLLLTPVLWRLAGAETFGLWTILYASQQLLLLATLGLGQAAVKYVSEFAMAADDGQSLGAVLATCYAGVAVSALAAAAGVGTLSPGIAGRLANDAAHQAELRAALSWIAIGLAPFFVHQVSRGTLLGLVRNKTAGLIDVCQALLTTGGLIVVVAAGGGGVSRMAQWNAAVNTVICAMSTGAVWRAAARAGIRLTWDRTIGRAIGRYSFFAWGSIVGSFLFGSADRILVGALLGAPAAGAYGIATAAAEKLTQLTAPLSQVLCPFASNYQAAGQLRAAGAVFRHASRLVACLLAGAAGVLLLWDRYVLTVWISAAFGDNYVVPFRLLVLCYATFSVAAPGYQILFGLGRVGILAGVGLAGSLVSLALVTLLAPSFGVVGAAAANFGYLIVLGASYAAARFLGLPPTRTLLAEVAPALAAIYAAALVTASDPSIAVRASATAALLGYVLWLSLGRGRASLIAATYRSRGNVALPLTD